MTNKLTLVKADAQIQRCAIGNSFSKYKPEGEKHTKKFKVEENETLKQLKDAFRKFRFDEVPLSDIHSYIYKLTKSIHYTANDITNLSITLSEFQNMKDFSKRAGFFLSVIINNHIDIDTNFIIVTNSFSYPINFFGYRTTKNITVQGDVGSYAGYLMKCGSITVKGNAGESVGGDMGGGAIFIEGDYESLGEEREIRGGNIFHKGKQIVKNGKVSI